jgi:hypothetical protein
MQHRIVRDVVLTFTLNVEAEVALILTLAGTEQVAPTGAPVQPSDAVPPTPSPPTESL